MNTNDSPNIYDYLMPELPSREADLCAVHFIDEPTAEVTIDPEQVQS